MDDEADKDWESDIIKQRMADAMAKIAEAMIMGPPRKQRQTALRVRGRSFETVELDDDGKIIEPVRCICGCYAVIHWPPCPFANLLT